jgi:hypothetical protein
MSNGKSLTMRPKLLSCRCGTVQLEISSAPVAQFYCHCDDCRAVTGGAFIPLALFAADSVAVIGNPVFTWTYKTLPRTRCSTCGTFLFGEPPGSGVRGVSGYLLSADEFGPSFHIHCQSAVIPVNDRLPHFKGLPASFGGNDATVEW